MALARIDCDHDRLRAETIGGILYELRIVHGGSIDTDLVGARIHQPAHVFDHANATTDGERNKYLIGDTFDDVEDQATLIRTRGDIEKRDFVCAFIVVAFGDFNRVAGIAQIDEIDALDHAAGVDIETGDDAFG